MTYTQANKVKNGALIAVKGKDYKGDKINFVLRFNSEYITSKGYLHGSTLYPFEWLTLASENDYLNAVIKASENFNKQLDALKQAYEISKQQALED